MPDSTHRQHDHLAVLSMAGPEASSAGSYTPERLDLTLRGASQMTDLVVYVHEMHHQGLNDATAWGAALHILSAVGPRQRACFAPLLDLCRLTHEAFATFASVSIVAVHHADTESVLAEYPEYRRLYRSLAALTAGAGGPQRAYLLATALARVSMQTPILALMLAADDLVATTSDVPQIDTPDGRFAWLIRTGRTLTDTAARAADDRVTAVCATAGLEADAADRPARASTGDEFDEHWQLWEREAYAVLAAALAGAGATVLEFNGHIEPCGVVVERARALEPALPVRAARPHSPAPDDATLSGAMIQFVRLNLVETPRRARLDATPVGDLPTQSVGAETDGSRGSTSVIHVRLPRRLLDSYRWPAEDAAVLEAAAAPITAVRLIEPGPDESTIAHVLLQKPAAIGELTLARPGLPPLLVVAAASCFIDTEWTHAWLPAIGEASRLVLLIDIEAARFASSWARNRQGVRASVIRVADTGGVYWAAALRVGEDAGIWLQLGDEVTVKLMLAQLRDTDGLQLNVSPEHVQDDGPLLTDAIMHVLATESFLDLRGLDEGTIRRATARHSA